MLQRCANCNINYDAGRFCPRCGRLLVEANPPNYRAIIITTIVIITVISLSIVFFAFFYWGKFMHERASYKEVNGFENSYSELAEELNLVAPCFKISPNAVSYDWFTPTYKRSYCIYRVAILTHDVNLCKQVKSTYLFGREVTRANCEIEAKKNLGDHHHSTFSTFNVHYELILRSLGYKDEDVMKLGPSTQSRKDFYVLFLIERNKTEFRAKLATLPNFSISDEDAKKQIYSMSPECLKRPTDNPLCLQIDNGLMRRW